MAGLVAGVTGGERKHPETLPRRPQRDLAIACALRQRDGEMHPRLVAQHLDASAHLLAQRVDEYPASLAVDEPHPAEMTREVAFRDEVGEHALGNSGPADVHRIADCGEVRDEILRDHDVAETQRREQHLAERADIDDPAVSVQPLERGDRRAAIAVLAVVVVLDDPGSVSLRPVEELEPA